MDPVIIKWKDFIKQYHNQREHFVYKLCNDPLVYTVWHMFKREFDNGNEEAALDYAIILRRLIWTQS